MALNTITVAQYKTAVRNRLDDDSYDAGKLLQFLNDANRDICNSHRWRFMEKTFTGLVTIGATSYDLPTGFQAAINFTLIDPDGVATFVEYMPYEIYDQTYPDPSALPAGTPSIWTFYGNSLIIGPAKPDIAYTMQLRYIQSPKTLANDTDTLDIPDEFSEIVVLEAFKRGLMTNDQFFQAQVLQGEIDSQKANMNERLQSRQFGEPVRMRIGKR